MRNQEHHYQTLIKHCNLELFLNMTVDIKAILNSRTGLTHSVTLHFLAAIAFSRS